MSRGWSRARCAAVPVAALAISSLAGCAADEGGLSLAAQAEQGREIARTNGCAACHGTNGQGGVGPSLTGLYGSQVTLADGSTVVADEAYLAESIRTPGVSKSAGYDIDMPSNNLDDDQIAAVIAYIRALASTGGDA